MSDAFLGTESSIAISLAEGKKDSEQSSNMSAWTAMGPLNIGAKPWEVESALTAEEETFWPLFRPLLTLARVFGLWGFGRRKPVYILSLVYGLLWLAFHLWVAILTIKWFEEDDDAMATQVVAKTGLAVIVWFSLYARLHLIMVHHKATKVFQFLHSEFRTSLATSFPKQRSRLKVCGLLGLVVGVLVAVFFAVMATLATTRRVSGFGSVIDLGFDYELFSRRKGWAWLEFLGYLVVFLTAELVTLVYLHLCAIVAALMRNLMDVMTNGDSEKRLLDHSLILKFHETYHHISNLALFVNKLFSFYALVLILTACGLAAYNVYYEVRSGYEAETRERWVVWLLWAFLGLKTLVLTLVGVRVFDGEETIYANIRRLYQHKIHGRTGHSRSPSMTTTELGVPGDDNPQKLKNPLLKFSVEVELFIQEIIGSDIKLTAGGMFDINRSLVIKVALLFLGYWLLLHTTTLKCKVDVS